MTVNLATAKFKVTGGTLSESLGDRAARIINVKDFGAVGDWNGTTGTDDTTAIQAAFTAMSPGGQANPSLNRPVFLPPGNYRTTLPLNVLAQSGGLIFGAGKHVSTITYTGSGTQGQTISTAGDGATVAGYTPIIMTDGVNQTKFKDFSITGTTTNRTSGGSTTMGFFMYQPASGSTGRGVTSACCFENLSISNVATDGAFLGVGANCENMDFLNCDFDQCDIAGIFANGYNSLNNVVIGGVVSNCAINATYNFATVTLGVGGGLCNSNGSISTIMGVRFVNNKLDILNLGGQGMSIMGGTTDGGASFAACIASSGALFVSGFTYGAASTGCFVDTQSAPVHVSSCYFNPPSNTGAGAIVRVTNAFANFDNNSISSTAKSAGVFNCGIIKGSGSTLDCASFRNNNFDGTQFPPVVTDCTKFADISSPPVTVAQLPTASASYKGIRLTVSDLNVAVVFGNSVLTHGGGATAVPVFCTGADWVMGG